VPDRNPAGSSFSHKGRLPDLLPHPRQRAFRRTIPVGKIKDKE